MFFLKILKFLSGFDENFEDKDFVQECLRAFDYETKNFK